MLYADVAPLPRTLADHLLSRFMQGKDGTQEEIESLFISGVRRSRYIAFSGLDSFVRSNTLARNRKEMLGRLRDYGHDVPEPTYTVWRRTALQSGMPESLFLMCLFITAMMTPAREKDDTRQYAFFPVGGIPSSDTWYCYVQRDPCVDIEDHPVNQLSKLPASAVCWTLASSPYWEEEWSLIGDAPTFLGCMRFAGIKRNERGELCYDVNEHDIKRWSEKVGSLYVPTEGNAQAQVQDLCRPLFNHLAVTKLKRR